MKENLNSHLVEVNCAFDFDENQSTWDSTYFGQFYEKIKDFHLVIKEERRGIQIKLNDSDVNNPVATEETQEQIIFKTQDSSKAVMLSKNRVSFHIMKNYTNWEDFRSNFILPILDIYLKMGLGQGTFSTSIFYLNRFDLPTNAKISDFISFIKPVENENEVQSGFERVFVQQSHILVIRGNFRNDSTIQSAHLECGCAMKNLNNINIETIQPLIDSIHLPIKKLFESTITDNLKQLL